MQRLKPAQSEMYSTLCLSDVLYMCAWKMNEMHNGRPHRSAASGQISDASPLCMAALVSHTTESYVSSSVPNRGCSDSASIKPARPKKTVPAKPTIPLSAQRSVHILLLQNNSNRVGFPPAQELLICEPPAAAGDAIPGFEYLLLIEPGYRIHSRYAAIKYV